jgi:hypothetical protein
MTDAGATSVNSDNSVIAGANSLSARTSPDPQNSWTLSYDPPLVANGSTFSAPLTNANPFGQNNNATFAGATDLSAGTGSGGEMNQFNHASFATFAAALAPDPGPSSSDAIAGATTDLEQSINVPGPIMHDPGPVIFVPNSGSSSGAPVAGVATPPDFGPSSGGTAASITNTPDPGPSSSNAFAGATTGPGSSIGVSGPIMHDPGPVNFNPDTGLPIGDQGQGIIVPGPSIGGTAGSVTLSDPAAPVSSTWQQSLTLLGNYMASTFTPPAFGDSGSSGPDVLPLPPPGSFAPQPLMDHHNSA